MIRAVVLRRRGRVQRTLTVRAYRSARVETIGVKVEVRGLESQVEEERRVSHPNTAVVVETRAVGTDLEGTGKLIRWSI